MNVSRRYLGDVFTIIVLVLGTGALQSLIVDSSSSKAISEGNPFLQVVWACIYVITAIRAGQQPRAILEMIRSNKLLIGLSCSHFFPPLGPQTPVSRFAVALHCWLPLFSEWILPSAIPFAINSGYWQLHWAASCC